MHAFDFNCTVQMRIGLGLGVLKALHASVRAQCCFPPAGGAVEQRLRAELNTTDCLVFVDRIKTMFFIPFSVSLCLS